MDLEYTLCEATPADAYAIAHIFALSWKSPFAQLQFGNPDPADLAAAMVPRIKEQILIKSHTRFVVIRDTAGEVVAVAQWTIPVSDDEERMHETEEDRAEREHFEDEAYRKALPETSNKDLVMEFTVGLRWLRARVLQGNKHFGMLSSPIVMQVRDMD